MAEQSSIDRGRIVLDSDESIIYIEGNRTLLAKGNASLSSRDILLLADRVSWDKQLNLVHANGSVSLNYYGTRILADDLTLELDNGNYSARNIRGGNQSLLFEASSIQRDQEIVELNQSKVFLYEPSPLTFNLKLSDVQIDANSSKITASGTDLKVGDITWGRLPRFSATYDNQNVHFQPHFGIGKEGFTGWYIELGLSRQLDLVEASGNVKLTENRGTLLSPQLDWLSQHPQNLFTGSLNGDWIRDEGSSGLDRRGYLMGRDRGQIHFSSVNRIEQNLRIVSTVDWETDSEFKRDYKRDSFSDDQCNQSFAEISYNSPYGSVSLFSEWQSNNHESITQAIPLLSFQSGPRKLATAYPTTPLNWGILQNVEEFGQRSRQTDRIDLGYKIQKPIVINRGITLTPSWDIRQRKTQHCMTDFDHTVGGFGADLDFSFHRKFDLNSSLMEINRILHLSNFSLAFRDKNTISGGRAAYIPSAQFSPNFNYESIDLLDHAHEEWFKPYHILRGQWINHLVGQYREKTRSLARTRMYIDLLGRLPEASTSSRFFYSEIVLHPWPWISLTHGNKFDLSNNENYKTVTGITFIDGRFHEVTLRYAEYVDFNDFFEFAGWKRINERTQLSLLSRYDLSANRSTYIGSTLSFLTSGNWSIEFNINKRKGTARENTTEWRLGASLSTF